MQLRNPIYSIEHHKTFSKFKSFIISAVTFIILQWFYKLNLVKYQEDIPIQFGANPFQIVRIWEIRHAVPLYFLSPTIRNLFRLIRNKRLQEATTIVLAQHLDSMVQGGIYAYATGLISNRYQRFRFTRIFTLIAIMMLIINRLG